jgi:uncharacterized SAM-binding protein YcdF (DUF218 family)
LAGGVGVIAYRQWHIKRTKWIAVALILGATFALALFAFSHAGTWLVVEDPLQPSLSVVVFGGKTPFRAIEAAKLYKEGWAREVWLTEGVLSTADVALVELGIERTQEHVYNRQVLECFGVPSAAIRLIETRNNNTATEVRTIARAVRESCGDRVILVTSSYHTRRVKALWRTFVGNWPEAVVRSAPNEAFDAKNWWRDTADAWAVSREWFGLINARVGFPLKSEHW